MTSLKKLPTAGKVKRKFVDISKDTIESAPSQVLPSVSLASDSYLNSGSGSEDSPARGAEAVLGDPVLSHAERRRRKKRKLNPGDAAPIETSPESHANPASASSKLKKGKAKKEKKSGEVSESNEALPKRQNSVWVGNLAYKTTPVTLKGFFEGLEVTRIHMPLKAPRDGSGPKVNSGQVTCVHFTFRSIFDINLISIALHM